MGALTLANMRTLVKRTINNRSDVDTEIDQIINQSYLETAMLRGLYFKELDAGPFTFNTVDGTRTYSFATALGGSYESRDVIAVYGMYDTTSKRPLSPHSVTYFDKLDQSIEGKPTWFAHYGTGIELHQTPDAVYAIRFRVRYRPDRLSAVSDVSILPEEFDFPIIWQAASFINATIGNLDKSSFYQSLRRDSLLQVSTSLEVADGFEDFALAPDLT